MLALVCVTNEDSGRGPWSMTGRYDILSCILQTMLESRVEHKEASNINIAGSKVYHLLHEVNY